MGGERRRGSRQADFQNVSQESFFTAVPPAENHVALLKLSQNDRHALIAALLRDLPQVGCNRLADLNRSQAQARVIAVVNHRFDVGAYLLRKHVWERHRQWIDCAPNEELADGVDAFVARCQSSSDSGTFCVRVSRRFGEQ